MTRNRKLALIAAALTVLLAAGGYRWYLHTETVEYRVQSLLNQVRKPSAMRQWLIDKGVLEEPDRYEIRKEIVALGQDAVPALAAAMDDPELRVRFSAIWVLRDIVPQDPTVVPALIRGMADPVYLVRKDAAGVAGRMGPKAAEASDALFVLAVWDGELSVRRSARVALTAIGPGAVETLRRGLPSADPGQMVVAGWLLGRMGSDAAAALPELRQALRSPDKHVRLAAAAAICQIEPDPAPEARKVFISLIEWPPRPSRPKDLLLAMAPPAIRVLESGSLPRGREGDPARRALAGFRRIAASGEARKASLAALGAGTDAQQAIANRLRERIRELNFDQIELKDVIQFLRDVSGANIFVEWQVLERADIHRNTAIDTALWDVTLADALSEVLWPFLLTGDVDWRVSGRTIVISTPWRLTSQEASGIGWRAQRRERKLADLEAGEFPQQALARRLRECMREFNMDEIELYDVLQFFRDVSDLSIDSTRAQEVRDTPIDVHLVDIPLAEALDLVLMQVGAIDWWVADGKIIIGPVDQAPADGTGTAP